MLCNILKNIIEGRRYLSKEDFQTKLDILFAGNRITQENYLELTELLAAQPEDKAN